MFSTKVRKMPLDLAILPQLFISFLLNSFGLFGDRCLGLYVVMSGSERGQPGSLGEGPSRLVDFAGNVS